ncbi:hypothetical protein CDAR_616621 [Caerostris darwini]|uniref:Uncharacterized protein n=1 Tax=Caerostris darwini TaxID=1538125 RepID=A0AAV4VV76_9ARAC|nr:hypothetical protein CDAR_616621 [Caerostris darwini]
MDTLNDSLCLQDLVGGLHQHHESSMSSHIGPLVGPGPAQPLAVCSSLHAMTHHRLDNNAVGMHGQTMATTNDHKKRGETFPFNDMCADRFKKCKCY